MVLTIATYFFAVVGALYFCIRIANPLIWLALYATGHLIFQLRTAGPAWRTTSATHKLKVCARFWLREFCSAASWPADEVTCGPYKWTPLFKYSGFKKAAQAQKETK